MEQSWDFEFLSRIADSCMAFLSEFVDDWLANDMRVSIFKILLVWLIFSLVAIHFAWKVYGTTVNDMYYRQGEDETPQILSCLMTVDGSDVLSVDVFRYWTEWWDTGRSVESIRMVRVRNVQINTFR